MTSSTPTIESHPSGRLDQPLFGIVYEDAEFLVVNKPAGLVCHPTKNGPLSSLISRAGVYLGLLVHPCLINRLDRKTSGLVVLAKTLELLESLVEFGKVVPLKKVTSQSCTHMSPLTMR